MFYNLAKVNSIKRARDFGSDGKIVFWIVTASFAINIILLLVGIFQAYGILPSTNISSALDGIRTVSGEDPLITLKKMSEAMKDASPFYMKFIGYITNIIRTLSFIMWVFLMFRPGTPGDTAYGKDPARREV